MNTECLVFYSWESDRKECRSFVQNTIDKLPSKLKGITTVTIDRDTVGVPGSPDIGDTIFEKIDRCDVFIADATLINSKSSKYRLTPNPNVLIELGYAIKAVGWDHIIILQCEDYGNVEDLPFDINHRRISKFTLGKGKKTEEEKDAAKIESRKSLLSNMVETINLLKKKGKIHGGKKNIAPKFEISHVGLGGGMSGVCMTIKNVSSKYVSELQHEELYVEFEDGSIKDDLLRAGKRVTIKSKSLNTGEETVVEWNNKAFSNSTGAMVRDHWENFAIHWRFKCEDENGDQFFYEVSKRITSSKNLNELETDLKCVYIG